MARSDSPPPIAQMSSRAATSTSAASPTEAPQTTCNNMGMNHNDLLHGIGSQFSAIDDDIQTVDIHPKL
ncbi:hypothetical protein J3E68DRAFT_32027 [Trichoderma sp. SZMC 28012]